MVQVSVMVEACVGWADGILSRVACLCRVAGLAPGRGSIQARCPALFWTGVPDSFAAEGSALLKAKLVIRLKQRVVEVELAHLLAYNVITRTPVNIDVGALPSPNCRKAWEIMPWIMSYSKGGCSKISKIPDHVISVGFVLQLITDFYLHVCEVNDYLGLGSELSALDPWFHWARSLPTIWHEAFVFSTRRVAP